jgi:ferredoxin-NADP reductase
MRVEAGQFFTWRFLTGAGWSRGNPYSLSAAPDGRSLRITVQGVGDSSNAIGLLTSGTRVLAEGPFGRLSDRRRTRSKIAFIGAGVGITPLRSLAEGLDYAPGDAVYIERCTNAPLFVREVDTLSAERGLRVLRMPGRRRRDGSWLAHHAGNASDVTSLLHWVRDIADRDVYVCGPAAWADLVCTSLRQAGLPDEQLHLETFTW